MNVAVLVSVAVTVGALALIGWRVLLDLEAREGVPRRTRHARSATGPRPATAVVVSRLRLVEPALTA